MIIRDSCGKVNSCLFSHYHRVDGRCIFDLQSGKFFDYFLGCLILVVDCIQVNCFQVIFCLNSRWSWNDQKTKNENPNYARKTNQALSIKYKPGTVPKSRCDNFISQSELQKTNFCYAAWFEAINSGFGCANLPTLRTLQILQHGRSSTENGDRKVEIETIRKRHNRNMNFH